MFRIYQKTLSSTIDFEGIGLHSGKLSKVKVLPAKENSGIVFKRVDLNNNNLIKANFANVSSAVLCTTIENKHGTKVSTIEHLMAAFYMADIDNAIVEINSEEVPIMDGSAKVFLKLLNEAGSKTLVKKRKYLKVLEKIELVDGKRKISIEPLDKSLEVEFQLNYKNELIGNQKNKINFETDNLQDVSDSRTFCLFEDIEKIKKAGLAKGGSLDNALVIDQNKVLNKEGLRNSKEFVNHKILDLAGDFLLSGHRIVGKIKCYQGGHELTNLFLRKIFSQKSMIKVFELDDILIAKKIKSTSAHKLAANA